MANLTKYLPIEAPEEPTDGFMRRINPGDVSYNSSAVLFFRTEVADQPFWLELSLNNDPFFYEEVRGDDIKFMHLVLPMNRLQDGDQRLQFLVKSGNYVRFRDIVIFYTANVTELEGPFPGAINPVDPIDPSKKPWWRFW